MQVFPNNFNFLNIQQAVPYNQFYTTPVYLPPLKQKPNSLLTSYAMINKINNKNACISKFKPNKFDDLNFLLNHNNQSFIYPQNIIFDKNKKTVIREKNRIASKKWRSKKDEYMRQLENENDDLRKQALGLVNKKKELKSETNFLTDELQYFESLISNNVLNKK